MLNKIGKGWLYTVLSVLLNIVAVKIIAVVLGPQGTGIFSILEKVIKVAVSVGTFGGRSPLTQGIASMEAGDNKPFLSSVATIYLAATGIVALMMMGLADVILRYLSVNAVGDHLLIIWAVAAVVLAVLSEFYVGILNGNRLLEQVFVAQMLRMLCLALLAYPIALIISDGRLEYYAWIFVVAQFVSLIYGVLKCRRHGIAIWPFSVAPKISCLRRFGSFSLLVLLGAFIGQGGILLSRLIVVDYHGIEAAGMFETAWAISAAYIGLILNSIGLYFLPAVSEKMETEQRNAVIRRVLVLATVVATLALSVMIVLKPILVSLLYSTAFLDSLVMIQWMLVGELLKIVGWVFGVALLGVQLGLWFLIINSVFMIGFIGLLFIGMEFFDDMVVVGVAYFISGVGYLILSCVVARAKLNFDFGAKDIRLIVFGLIVVLLISSLFWGDLRVAWNKVVPASAIIVICLSFMIWKWGEGIFFRGRAIP